MLISPPFLPPRGTLNEENWFNTAMSGGQPGAGAFPASYLLEWHGGIHLTAPMSSTPTISLPVRAIADGTVVYLRRKTDVPASDVDAPLNYGAGYTSDGVVVIRHDTDIGVNAQDQLTQVRFYSVYLHLDSIQPTVIQGRHIYRKDEIGQAGHIEGVPHMIHFEICCDAANLARLVGRGTGDLPLTANGRTDVLFGEMYFHLPAGTPVYPAKPLPQHVQAMTQPAAAPTRRGQPAAPLPAPQPLQAVHTTAEPLVVGLLYAGGSGEEHHRGDAVLTTYRLNGVPVSTSTTASPSSPALITESEAEYKLYTTAKTISEAYPATARPSISAVYELLRFGRVIGPDALTPADVPHWREVVTLEGRGWVNLNAANVHKYSDADFPQWKGWTLVDDDTNGDSRCDSASLKRMVFTDEQEVVQPFSRANAERRLGIATVREKLARTVCQFPSEWDASTIDARWAWIKTADAGNPGPLSEEDYGHLKAHLQALCIPLPELFTAQWCFDPREFIRHFRRCGWLSAGELAQTLPNKPGYTNAGTVRRALNVGRISLATALQRTALYVAPFNNAMRKYGISCSRVRQAQFFAQVMLETDKWQTMEEYGRGAPVARIPMIQYYAAFYGRGIMQLTWAGNYEAYGKYRALPNSSGGYNDTRITATSTHYWGDPTLRGAHNAIIGLDPHKPARQWAPRFDPALIHQNPHNACDSGGHYWTSKNHAGHQDINRIADLTFEAASIGRVSVLVNGGGNGYFERLAYAYFAYRILSDDPTSDLVVQLPAARDGVSIDVDFTRPT